MVGIAPNVSLHSVKVLSRTGSGSIGGAIAGLDWVANETRNYGVATVANMSLEGFGSKSGTCTTSEFSGLDAFHESICNVKNAGVIITVAAGNNGTDAENTIPAAYDDAVITVSATTTPDDWPSWSNWGNNSANWTGINSAPIAIAAPGVDILSTNLGGGTKLMSGTSMAAPHVAGAIAFFLDNYPQLPNSSAFFNARDWLLSTAEDTNSFDNNSGHLHHEKFTNSN